MELIIFSIVAGVVFCFADIYTTKISKDIGITEKTDRYQLPDGRANLKRIVLEKAGMFAVALVVSFVIYLNTSPENKQFAFLLVYLVSVMSGAIAISNYSIYRKRKRQLEKLNK